MKKILVTGADGQLGKCLKAASGGLEEFSFVFMNRTQLDIANFNNVQAMFAMHSPDYCINAAAYTYVDKAESEKEKAFLVNAKGAKNIAAACEEHGAKLLHISTDYVFDGEKQTPYVESDATNPINVYGASKLKGEEYIREGCPAHFIIRTSWLYSQYGHNFFNAMLQFAEEGRDLKITTEQLGTPTNANDLARALIAIVVSGNEEYGIFHFSNEGEGTWYDFAYAIFEHSGKLDDVNLEKTDHYRTFAARPDYSVLSKEKFRGTFGMKPKDWNESLKQLIDNLNS